MTTPLIVITVEGGVIQDISVSLQARVIVVDRDAEGAKSQDLVQLHGRPAHISDFGLSLPNKADDAWLKDVLLCLPR